MNDLGLDIIGRKILKVRPGVTGYNQAINRNAVGTKEKLKNDIYYVEHMSFLFDVKIICMTVKTVLFRKNIYRVDKG
ncbi:sugar transferase [Hungatella hathewayi]|uniref:sugar transferase n=1 Tax=Hungatella hathewayi TaxID=154046 RepID=UPI003D80FDBB